MKEYIIFKKQREVGEILSDTFKFIRLEGKALFGYILRLAGPALLLLVIALSVYTRSIATNINGDIFTNTTIYSNTTLISIMVMILAGLSYYALLYGVVNHYVRSYIKHQGKVVSFEVTQGVRKDFWNLLGMNTLIALMVGFGLVLCFLPGVYLGVSLFTCYSIFIHDNQDVSSAISYSFKLITNEWWITFATILIMFILFYVMVIVFNIPQYIYFFAKSFVIVEDNVFNATQVFDWGYVLLSAIGTIGQYLAHTLIVVASIFIYFNLNEKKNMTGTLEKIDSIGNPDPNDTLITRY